MIIRRWFTTTSSVRIACSQILQYSRGKSSSSTRWLQRQGSDAFTREAKVRDYASRAAFKLIELDKQHRLFKSGMTVVDLGFAPGSWTQIAVQRVNSIKPLDGDSDRPHGTVIGVDILHAPPPNGASAIQGNFLSVGVQSMLREMLAGKKVDVVLSDMCAPWPQTSGYWINNVNEPFIRMANTTGLAVRDHGASIDLCDAALLFAVEELKDGGSFVCKFFSGSEDGELEKRLKTVFKHVKRDKPQASRKESKEMYFVALGKKPGVTKEQVWQMF